MIRDLSAEYVRGAPGHQMEVIEEVQKGTPGGTSSRGLRQQ
jgi:hypothetical protein